MTFATGYALTLLVEVPLLLAVMRALGWLPVLGLPRALLVGWLVNLTHPVLWGLTAGASWSAVLAGEVVVVLVEALALTLLVRRLGGIAVETGTGLLAAVLTNSVSFGVGLVLLTLFG